MINLSLEWYFDEYLKGARRQEYLLRMLKKKTNLENGRRRRTRKGY